MTALIRKNFLGLSVTGFNCNAEWGAAASTLTVDLVRDPVAGDVFAPVQVGTPVYFTYYGFSFNGIVQKYDEQRGQSGNPLFSVTVTDCKEILNGVQMIIGDYTGGTYNIPNLYNIYGYYESFGFGNSGVNSGGMPWLNVRDGITTLVATTPINYRGHRYYIDISRLNVLPAYYRISGQTVMTLMDFITKVCQDSCRDFYVKLVYGNGVNVITVYTVDKSVQPQLGRITEFVDSVEGAVSKNNGVEFKNEPTSKFLVGGNINTLYGQYRNFGYKDIINDVTPDKPKYSEYLTNNNTNALTIEQYMGVDILGNAILYKLYTRKALPFGLLAGPLVTFKYAAWKVNSVAWDILGVGAEYETDIGELQAALGGQATWEAHLTTFDSNPASAHYDKIQKLGFNNLYLSQGLFNKFLRQMRTGAPRHKAVTKEFLAPFTGNQIRNASRSNIASNSNRQKLYDKVRTIAEEYYGKKFMVQIPTMSSKYDAETNSLEFSHTPVDAGFIDETEWANSVGNNMVPNDWYKFRTSEGKISAYVRYRYYDFLDDSEISDEDFVVNHRQPKLPGNKTETFAFVRCSVDTNPVFEDRVNGIGARAVITLPGRIYIQDINTELADKTFIGAMYKEALNEAIRLATLPAIPPVVSTLPGPIAGTFVHPYVSDARRIAIDAWFASSAVGERGLFNRFYREPVYPDFAAIPLLSHTERYGPWYQAGAYGGTTADIQDTLVPWNYGGYAQLNNIARAMVDYSFSNQQESETGTVEFPGAPLHSIGDELVSNGPYINSVNVNIGTNGVTTTYRLDSWTPQFGGIVRAEIDRQNRIQQSISELKVRYTSILRLVNESISARGLFGTVPQSEIPSQFIPNSTSSIIMGTMNKVSGEINAVPSISIMPNYYVGNQTSFEDEDYARQGAMSLDGLFRPFSTYSGDTFLPHYEAPTASGANNRNVLELNPFPSGSSHDLGFIARDHLGSGFVDELYDDNLYTQRLRGIGLRAPMILVGWGYDTDGKPVPNSGVENNGVANDNFIADYHNRSDKWKAGPLDVAWDNTRKVWAAGGGSQTYVGKILGNLFYRQGVSTQLYNYNEAASGHLASSTVTAYDWLLPSGGYIQAYTNVFVSKANGRYYITSAGCGAG